MTERVPLWSLLTESQKQRFSKESLYDGAAVVDWLERTHLDPPPPADHFLDDLLTEATLLVEHLPSRRTGPVEIAVRGTFNKTGTEWRTSVLGIPPNRMQDLPHPSPREALLFLVRVLRQRVTDEREEYAFQSSAKTPGVTPQERLANRLHVLIRDWGGRCQAGEPEVDHLLPTTVGLAHIVCPSGVTNLQFAVWFDEPFPTLSWPGYAHGRWTVRTSLPADDLLGHVDVRLEMMVEAFRNHLEPILLRKEAP